MIIWRTIATKNSIATINNVRIVKATMLLSFAHVAEVELTLTCVCVLNVKIMYEGWSHKNNLDDKGRRKDPGQKNV